MTDLLDLAKRAHEASVAKGFDPPRWADEEIGKPPSNYLAKLMLVITEIDEVYRAENREALGEELADVVLRVLPMLLCCHGEPLLNDLALLVKGRKRPYSIGMRPQRWDTVIPLITGCVRAAEAWRKDMTGIAALALHDIVLGAFFLADQYDIDLFAAVEAKMVKNAARPYRHGKKSTG